jgi:hypothetical protein
MKQNNEQEQVGEGVADGGAGSVVETGASAEAGADTPTETASVPSTQAEPDEVHDDAPAEGADEAAPATGADTASADGTEAKPVEPAASALGRIDAPGSEPADLLDSGDGSVVKKLVAVGGASLALLVLLTSKRRGRRNRNLAAAMPDLPNLATAQKLGRSAAKRARKAARRR